MFFFFRIHLDFRKARLDEDVIKVYHRYIKKKGVVLVERELMFSSIFFRFVPKDSNARKICFVTTTTTTIP